MAYSADTFVADEQPTTAKWNKLWSNDASFNDGSGIGDDTIDSRHYVAGSIDYEHLGTDIGAYQELADVTLGSAGDTIASGTITAKTFLIILFYVIATGGTVNNRMRFNGDSGSNYSERSASNGGADATAVSQTTIGMTQSDSAAFRHGICRVTNLAAQEKLVIAEIVEGGTAGAGNTTNRAEARGKWANTSAQITSVSLINTGSGDYAIGSRLVVLGRD